MFTCFVLAFVVAVSHLKSEMSATTAAPAKSVTEAETLQFHAVVGHLTRRAHAKAYILEPLSGREG